MPRQNQRDRRLSERIRQPIIVDMNCPSCGAAMRLETDRAYFLCDYCGSVYFPEANQDGVRILGEQASMPCPVCTSPLVHASIGDHRMIYCEHCRGMLISMDVFMAIVEDLRSRHENVADSMPPPDPRDLDRRIRCPQCQQWMDTHPYYGPGNVIIDDCERCSLNWLDYGELNRIVRAPDHDYEGDAWKPQAEKPAQSTVR